MICTVMRGIIATSVTRPKASVMMLLPGIAWQAPMAKGSMKVAVRGPEATPPESKAMAVKVGGTNSASTRATR